ncbi:hypothetical protein ACEQPO_00120 [Bacillus sp. SL00103]
MDDIIAFIATLIEKGYAYEARWRRVLQHTLILKATGSFLQSIDELKTGARIRVGEEETRCAGLF